MWRLRRSHLQFRKASMLGLVTDEKKKKTAQSCEQTLMGRCLHQVS